MPKCLLTPTQKAKFTKTFFIRATFWTPSGSRVDLEIPWVPERAGADLLNRMTLTCGATHEGRTNEEWEAIATKALAESKKARTR